MKKLFNLFFVTLLALTLVACTGVESNDETKMITDPEGNQVSVPIEVERIIVSVPSVAEILIELGVGDKIVGVHNYMEDHEGLADDVAKIDFINLDTESVLGLQPDIIIATPYNKDKLTILEESGVPVVYIPNATSIDGIYTSIEFIADITNQVSEGNEIINNMKTEINTIKDIANTITEKKTVYFEVEPGTFYTTGSDTFVHEIIELVGAKNIFEDESGWFSAIDESIVAANPDVIISNYIYIENPIQEILLREGWEEMDAIIGGNVYLVDANSTSRPSHNIIKAVKEMAKLIYPEYYE